MTVGAEAEVLRGAILRKCRESMATKEQFFTENADRIADCAAAMARAFDEGGRLFVMGNGGSSCDAAHVSADRGSHGEGDYGRGHDTPHPPPGVNGTQMPNYMEKFDDCDNRALNPVGYQYGVDRTSEMFGRFLAKAPLPDTDDDDVAIDPQDNDMVGLDDL